MESESPRLLPWPGPEGKPCYLITDDLGGPVSRLADATESIQLGMGTELLAHARDLLPDTHMPAGELRFLAERLTEALQDALRVAESRGLRLGRLN
ncbi:MULTISPECIES: hypothetical protein [unclassified Streptomyces]|uniref:hypothetical protein n=1 Tax=unclassified Streptomyces TaxID=2593676 RepID=UPI0022530180|nr:MULTISPECIES: hypothetical protein [unclassified Streptomyces]MCX4882327.1 hypothetical protein [Streptomyces sp. NBC_00847]MCX5049817.1 hypothetical protein [Streptomyces sp. NBC_00474]MCX5060243.1 hypothetical protein [Streptomyces sp. NBC_00452]MCX5247725.1 hypothetical protein [Streptomyces sp. NBC_00201]